MVCNGLRGLRVAPSDSDMLKLSHLRQGASLSCLLLCLGCLPRCSLSCPTIGTPNDPRGCQGRSRRGLVLSGPSNVQQVALSLGGWTAPGPVAAAAPAAAGAVAPVPWELAASVNAIQVSPVNRLDSSRPLQPWDERRIRHGNPRPGRSMSNNWPRLHSTSRPF